jgi:hypothetical protein
MRLGDTGLGSAAAWPCAGLDRIKVGIPDSRAMRREECSPGLTMDPRPMSERSAGQRGTKKQAPVVRPFGSAGRGFSLGRTNGGVWNDFSYSRVVRNWFPATRPFPRLSLDQPRRGPRLVGP